MTNETVQNDEPRDATSTASDILGALFDAGAAWARYGLALGRASLNASAKSLELAAELLGGLSRAIQDAAELARKPSSSEEAGH